MAEEQKAASAELIEAWVESAYASMGREYPADFSLAYTVCLHWAAAGKICQFGSFTSEFGDVAQPPALDPVFADEYLDFKLYASDGTIRKIRRTG